VFLAKATGNTYRSLCHARNTNTKPLDISISKIEISNSDHVAGHLQWHVILAKN
jgi:hypothetical protein